MYSIESVVSAADLVTLLVGVLGVAVAGYGHIRIGSVEKLKAGLQMEVERFKAKLIADHDINLERFRADVRVAAHEKETVLTSLQEKRAGIIEELYANLVQTEDTLRDLTSQFETPGMGTKVERATAFENAHNRFRGHFDTHRIYFEEPLCGAIDAFLKALRKTYFDFVAHIQADPQGMAPGFIEAWIKCARDASEMIPALRVDLEREFRSLLGVEGAAPALNAAQQTTEPPEHNPATT